MKARMEVEASGTAIARGRLQSEPQMPAYQVVLALLSRMVLFALFQLVVAGLLAATGTADAWSASGAWWPLAAAAANLVGLGLLATWSRRWGPELRRFYVPARSRWKADLRWALGVSLVGGVLAAGTNVVLASWLYGDQQGGYAMLVQPLPLWAAIVSMIVFPVSTALAELPTYYGCIQPRLARMKLPEWCVVLTPAAFHALQHITMPFIFDGGYLLWRGLMYLPFAVLISWVLRRQPTLLPYLVMVHFVLDLSAGLAVLAVSQG